jgi:sporulation protein YlmC with PRC-barrel domain
MDNASASGALIKSSTIKGETILNAQKEKVGKADDIVLETHSGKVPFVVVSFGGFLGINDTLVPLPWDMFQVGSDGKLFAGNITKDELKNAPRFQKNDWAELKDPAFGERVYQHYGRQPNWLSERGGMRDPMDATRDALDRPGEDNFARLYSTGTAAEYNGTVRDIQYNHAVKGAAETTFLVIDTNSGEMDVYLAPRPFLDQNNVALKNGEKVTVRGRTAMVDGKKALIASDIRTADGKTVTIRNKDGAPAWDKR